MPEFDFDLLVRAERIRQDDMWGGQKHDKRHSPQTWLAILAEQLGHCARAVLCEDEVVQMRQLIHIAAVAKAWAEAMAARAKGEE